MGKVIVGFLLVIGIFCHCSLVNASVMDDRLCLDNEKPVFTFQTQETGKTVAICVAENYDYIVYRFGTKDNIELEFPESLKIHGNNSLFIITTGVAAHRMLA